MKKPFQFKGLWFFYTTIILLMISFFLDSEKAGIAIEKSIMMLVKLLPIFVLVILFTAMMAYWVKPKKMMQLFGEKGSLKGWSIALFGGILSHGPLYAWYSMFEELKKHGLSDGMIATFFYARAVKLPLLPIMIDYFGWTFTIVLNVLILVFAILQGMIVNRLK